MTEHGCWGDGSLPVEVVLPVRTEGFLVNNSDPSIVVSRQILVG